jgi:hypothetical protein
MRLIIPMILLYPSGPMAHPNVSRLDPSGAIWSDAEHPSRNRKVEVDTAVLVPHGPWSLARLGLVAVRSALAALP